MNFKPLPLITGLALSACHTATIDPDQRLDFPSAQDTGTEPTVTGTVDACTGYVQYTDINETAGSCLKFEEQAAQWGLVGGGNILNVSSFDFNNDGSPDIYVSKYNEPDQILENKNALGFVQTASDLGLPLSQGCDKAVHADYSGDGLSDFLCVSSDGVSLYKNLGGTYQLQTGAAGVDAIYNARGAAWTGATYLVGTDSGVYAYEYNSSSHEFTESRLSTDGDCGAFAVGDYDQDGRNDVYVGCATGSNKLYRSNADGSVEDVIDSTETAGAAFLQSMTANWKQLEGQSSLSLYVGNANGTNAFYEQDADGTFVESASTFSLTDAGQTVTADWLRPTSQSDFMMLLGRYGQSNLAYSTNAHNVAPYSYNQISNESGLQFSGLVMGAIVLNVDANVENEDGNTDGRDDYLVVTWDGSILLFMNQSYILEEE